MRTTLFPRALVGGAFAIFLWACAPVAASADVIEVTTTIQAAVDAANPGDTVDVPKGVYRENVLVTKDGITITGGVKAVLDGEGIDGGTGITVSSGDSDVRIQGFALHGLTIRNYRENGVLLVAVDDFEITDGIYENNEEYGVFPVYTAHGRVASNRASGSEDTGIYVGQSDDVVVEDNRATGNAVGFEIENSSNVTVRHNTAKHNSIGFFVSLLPGRTVKATTDITLEDNVASENNRPNEITDPTEELSLLPGGVGILNLGGDRVTIADNRANGNVSAGIAVVSVPDELAALDPEIDPTIEGDVVRNNTARHNGRDPDPRIAPLPGSDLLWDLSGSANCWSGNRFKTGFPTPFPECSAQRDRNRAR